MLQKCDGVKILDLEEKYETTGNEYIVTAEKDNNYKLPLESVADIVIGNSKFKAAIKDVYESSTPTASVSLDKDKFLFSFGIPAGRTGDKGRDGRDGKDGKDGKDGIDGVPGIDGDTIRTVLAYKSTKTMDRPDTPVGGTWDYANNKMIYPEGWYGDDRNPNGYVWQSSAAFSSNGTQVDPWTTPVCLTGADGHDGADGSNIEFIYKLTITNLVTPTKPTGNSQTEAIRQGWEDHPTGISEQFQCEWVCSHNLQPDGSWSEWEGPTIWSKWGVNGKDGDGVEYIYQRTKLPAPPRDITDNNPDQDEYIPQSASGEQRWTDNPTGVDEDFKYEWVSQRKYKGNTRKWGNFSSPSLWAKWGDDGQDGQHLRVMYTKTSGSDVKPADPDRLSINPGSIWSKAMPTADGKQAIWGIQALVDYANNLVIDETLPEDKRGWQGPYLITGVAGLDGNNYNYKIDVFKEGSVQPEPPTGNDPNNPGGGWKKLPDSSSGIWWKCTGLVNGVTETIIEWGAVIKVTGQGVVVKGQLDSTDLLPSSGNEIGDAYIIDGDLWVWNGTQWVNAGKAQGPEGNYTELRFAKNNSYSSPPALAKHDRNPSGWSTGAASSTSSGSVTWMTSALISGVDNTLLGDGWEDPWYVTGATGSSGVSGIPGVSYELRYSAGTATSYTATWNNTVRTTRDPKDYGWTMDLPTVDNTNKYIWFIQARIGYDSNYDRTGYLEDGHWEAPHLLSGINGLEPGGDAPIIYPAGVYAVDKTYVNDTSTAPYVWDPNGNAFYVLDTPMQWLGTEQGNRYPSDENVTAWVKFEMFDAMFADFGIINNALIGGAVFNNERMFSQAGIDSSGASNAHFERLSPSDTTEQIMNGSKNFIPNFLLDFASGEAYFGAGGIHLAADSKSSQLQLTTTDTKLTLDGSGLSMINNTGGLSTVGTYIKKSNITQLTSDYQFKLDSNGMHLGQAQAPFTSWFDVSSSGSLKLNDSITIGNTSDEHAIINSGSFSLKNSTLDNIVITYDNTTSSIVLKNPTGIDSSRIEIKALDDNASDAISVTAYDSQGNKAYISPLGVTVSDGVNTHIDIMKNMITVTDSSGTSIGWTGTKNGLRFIGGICVGTA